VNEPTKEATSPEYPPLKTRLLYAVVPVSMLLLGYAGVTHHFAGKERDMTLARMPERPALSAGNQALAPVLDKAYEKLTEAPTADQVGHLGKIYQANYFYDEAATCYQRAMELDRDNARWPYLLAYLQNMKGNTGEANTLIDQAIALDSTYIPAILRRGDNRYKSGEIAGATADYIRCLELDMTNEYARLGLGRIAVDEGNWTEAEKQLRMAVEANPRFGTAYRLLATVYENLGREDDMRRALATADPLGRFIASPDPWVDEIEPLCFDIERLLTKGFRADKIERSKEALYYFDRVLALDPDNFEATAQKGDLLQKHLQMEEAEPLLLKALSLPAPDPSHYSNINTNLGNNYFWQKAPEKAVPYYQAAIDQDPTLPAAHLGLATCYLALGRPEDALEPIEKATMLDPESHESRYNWGQALLKLDRLDEAMPHFAEAHRLEPTLPPPDYLAGNYFFRQGNMEKARPYLERALESVQDSGNHRLAAQIRTMLGQ